MSRLYYLFGTFFLILSACTTAHWECPYPPVPTENAPQNRAYYSQRGIRHDAVERNPAYKEVFSTIDAEVDQAVKRHPDRGKFGFIHTWFEVKRRILYWKYGIEWYSVQDMTPGLIID